MKLDPQTVRERMVRSYTRSYQRAQIAMTPAEVERQVVADCELVDSVRSAGDMPSASAPPPAPIVPDPRRAPRPAARAAQRAGLRLGTTGTTVKYRALDGNPQLVSERWGCAVARIARILEGVRRDTSSLVVAVEHAELATLATEFADLWGHFKTYFLAPPKTGVDRNPFRGLSGRDAARKFQRLTEDICDRSTGKLGPWVVK